MAELIRTRCTAGTLIITDESVIIEGPMGRGSQSMRRTAITSVQSKKGMPSLMGMGGGTNLDFHGQGGEVLKAHMVNPKDAKRILEIVR